VIAGLLLTAAAMRARAFDAALPEPEDGAPAALGHDIGGAVGRDCEFAPFRFAIVGPPRGDAAALDRALNRIADEGVQTTIVMGDILPPGGQDVTALVDVLTRNWRGLVLLAGPNDGAVEFTDARLAARVRPPSGWAFLEHGCLFRGTSTRALPIDAELGDPVMSFDFSTEPGAVTDVATRTFGVPREQEARLGYDIVSVGGPDRVTRTHGEVARGPSLASIVREAPLQLLWPFAVSMTGLFTILSAALVLTSAGVRLVRARNSGSRDRAA